MIIFHLIWSPPDPSILSIYNIPQMLILLEFYLTFFLVCKFRYGRRNFHQKCRISSLSPVFVNGGFTWVEFGIYKITDGGTVKNGRFLKSISGTALLPSPPNTYGCGLQLQQRCQKWWGDKDVHPIPPSGRRWRKLQGRKQWNPSTLLP